MAKHWTIYVIFVDKECRHQAVGSQLLTALNQMQIESGALEQLVSVQEGIQKGIPFYEAWGLYTK
ncbi:GNAT family N-acetyltransferase [Planococcus wigleyi]|uniref:GNAT family N-acetyltransferase n=1 Tax=Planococcus wigleyi TaxID=2762216 RepID=A0ABR8WFU6_9BACL|nr:GNAT family N-acetyltransferase [Planococcus wigleyi]MBD8015561.1 GNAT family N-acetyltransferase [Planococcus wigleyi]